MTSPNSVIITIAITLFIIASVIAAVVFYLNVYETEGETGISILGGLIVGAITFVISIMVSEVCFECTIPGKKYCLDFYKQEKCRIGEIIKTTEDSDDLALLKQDLLKVEKNISSYREKLGIKEEK